MLTCTHSSRCQWSTATSCPIHPQAPFSRLATPSCTACPSLLPVGDVLAPLVSSLPLELRPTIEAFLANCLAVFDDLDATLLEMNPFTFDGSGMPFPLDIRMVSQRCRKPQLQTGRTAADLQDSCRVAVFGHQPVSKVTDRVQRLCRQHNHAAIWAVLAHFLVLLSSSG